MKILKRLVLLMLFVVLLFSPSKIFSQDKDRKLEEIACHEIAQKIIECNNLDVKNIKFRIIESSTPSSYCYPDNTIVLTSGMIKLANMEDELAFVIGHEIAHIANKSCKKDDEVCVDLTAIDYIKNIYNINHVPPLLKKLAENLQHKYIFLLTRAKIAYSYIKETQQ